MRKWITLAALLTKTAFGVPIASSLATTGTASFFWGQSFTVVSAGPVDHIVFNFFSDLAATVPQAAGTGYLFSAAYSGSPGGLAGTVTNLLGTAAAAGNHWTFNPSLTLQAGTQYFFYTDTFQTTTGSGLNPYAGGQIAFSNDTGTNFAFAVADAAFLVDGTAAAAGAPEIDPRNGKLSMALAVCLIGLALSRTRRELVGS
ncbi:MAG: hypothetical protein U0931_13480 [Vulcanimicrobiota bacterium]